MNKYVVINIGCLECCYDSELVAVTNTLEEAKEIASKNYPGGGLVYGDDYEAEFTQMQTVIFPIDLKGEPNE
jgi:hypothetical protein